MCTKIAISLNIFNRDKELITKMDIIGTYLFLVIYILFLIYYTYKYYQLVDIHILHCKKTEHEFTCLKTEFIHVITPYLTTIYVFYNIIYNILNYTILALNICWCCYYGCQCKSNKNKIQHNTIELGKV